MNGQDPASKIIAIISLSYEIIADKILAGSPTWIETLCLISAAVDSLLMNEFILMGSSFRTVL